MARRLEGVVRASKNGEMVKAADDSQYILDLWDGQRPQIVSDRGRTMKSKLLGQTLELHQIQRSSTRPRTPFIDSFFSTLKGRPINPGRWKSFEKAPSCCLSFFPCFNPRHLRNAIGFVTPTEKHYARVSTILELRMPKARRARPRGLSINPSEKLKIKLDT